MILNTRIERLQPGERRLFLEAENPMFILQRRSDIFKDDRFLLFVYYKSKSVPNKDVWFFHNIFHVNWSSMEEAIMELNFLFGDCLIGSIPSGCSSTISPQYMFIDGPDKFEKIFKVFTKVGGPWK